MYTKRLQLLVATHLPALGRSADLCSEYAGRLQVVPYPLQELQGIVLCFQLRLQSGHRLPRGGHVWNQLRLLGATSGALLPIRRRKLRGSVPLAAFGSITVLGTPGFVHRAAAARVMAAKRKAAHLACAQWVERCVALWVCALYRGTSALPTVCTCHAHMIGPDVLQSRDLHVRTHYIPISLAIGRRTCIDGHARRRLWGEF